MLNICDLQGLYKHGLQGLHGAAVQVSGALPALSTSVQSAQLRSLIERQAAQATKSQLHLATMLTIHGAFDHATVDPVVAALLQCAESFSAQVGVLTYTTRRCCPVFVALRTMASVHVR